MRRALRPYALAGCLYAALALWPLEASLRCADECFVDHAALYGDFALLARNDTRLNAWILAWVQHSLLSAPSALFDANVFHPARGALAGSEHLIGLAIQLLPARAFTASAVTVHQLALALSAWLLGLSTFALVRWLVRPSWIAIGAGATAMLMPWRSLELMHVQLLAAHWIPLLWLLALRTLSGDSRRIEVWGFAAILGLTLLSSYYVAYLATISLGVLALGATVQRAVRWRGALRLAAAALPAYALLAAVSLPYVAREWRGELPSVSESAWELPEIGTAFVAEAARALAPYSLARPHADGALAHGYSIPATLAALACAALLLAPTAARGADEPLRRRQRVACFSLAGVALVCFVLMFGNKVHLAGHALELPAGWLARVLPGFASLRAPLRWSIPIALAAPVLASVGLALVCERARSRIGSRAGTAIVALPTLALLALELRPRSVGAELVWPDPEGSRAAQAALAALPPGPVLEAPWGAEVHDLVVSESASQLASTLDWRPTLNGFTAYPPASYDLLLRVARGLPGEAGLAELAKLTGLRWIVLHEQRLTPEARRAWDAAEAGGRLQRAWSDGATVIFEVPALPDTGALAAALAQPSPERTLHGLPRAPLEIEQPAGGVGVAGELGPFSARGLPRGSALALAIENTSDRDWPGFDPAPEGLVALRYAFADAAGSLVAGGVAPLDVDVPAGRVVRASPLVVPPAQGGRFRLCLDLVQRMGRELRPLPIAPLELDVEVEAMPTPPLARYAAWLASSSEVASYPCAVGR